MRIRPVLPSDRMGIIDFLGHLSRDSLELRFFSAVQAGVVMTELMGGAPPADRISLVMETIGPSGSHITGHGESIRFAQDRTRSEVGFIVADQYQGLGAATLLLWQLARAARAVGIRSFEAVVRSENRPMLDVFAQAGFPHTREWVAHEARVVLDITHDPQIALALPSPTERGAHAIS